MATKSFTAEMTFDKKSINSLIKALDNEKSQNRKPVKDGELIQKAFGRKK